MTRHYTWWVNYTYEYDWLNDEGQYEHIKDFDARRFKCLKKDIPAMVEIDVKEELECETYKNLKITIADKYITSDVEL